LPAGAGRSLIVALGWQGKREFNVTAGEASVKKQTPLIVAYFLPPRPIAQQSQQFRTLA
jgi:hypothetical protein